MCGTSFSAGLPASTSPLRTARRSHFVEAVHLGFDEQLAQRPVQFGVGVDGMGQTPHQRGVLLHLTVVGPVQEFPEVAAQGAGVDLREVGRLVVAQRPGDQLRLAPPLAVEGGLAGVGAGGDGVHGEGVVADLAEEVEHGRVQLGLPLGSEPAACHDVSPIRSPERNDFVQYEDTPAVSETKPFRTCPGPHPPATPHSDTPRPHPTVTPRPTRPRLAHTYELPHPLRAESMNG